MFEVNEIAEMTLQGQKSKSLKNNMNLRHHLTCRFAAGKNMDRCGCSVFSSFPFLSQSTQIFEDDGYKSKVMHALPLLYQVLFLVTHMQSRHKLEVYQINSINESFF